MHEHDLDPEPAQPAGAHRSRWAAIGAAVAVTLGAGGLMTAKAVENTGEKSVFVAITPCRVMDTRPAPQTVGARSKPLGPAETHTIQITGKNGNCDIPADADAVTMNVTVVNPTADSFLTVWPADATQPLASSLNYVNGQPPAPNAVTVDLSAAGKVSFFNNGGNADVVADIVGYYVDHNHDDRYYTKDQVDGHEALQKYIPIDLAGSNTEATFNADGSKNGLKLTDVDPDPITLNITVPPDLTPGAHMTLRLSYHIPQINCMVGILGYSTLVRTGSTAVTAPETDPPGFVPVGGNPSTAPTPINSSATREFTIGYPADGSGLQPGDVLSLVIGRDSSAVDTCTQSLYLSGAELVYS